MNPASRPFDPVLLLAGLMAASLPTLLGYSLPPSATLLNQCVAVAVWGLWAVAAGPASLASGTLPLLGALEVMALAVVGSFTLGSLPVSLGWSALGLLLCAGLMVASGASASQRGDAARVGGAFFGGLLAAGLLSALVALVQVFAPEWADGQWIATSGLAGRAVGNLRQPNHLCSLLLWAMAAAVALHELRWLGPRWLWAVVAVLVLAVELSASRTGAVGLGVLMLWGLADRRLSRPARVLLLCTPLLYALAYGAMAVYSELGHVALGASARMEAGGLGEGGSPNARSNIWRTAWALALAQPWLGVGFGEFNMAWTLTPFAGRPTAFFDHTHNLPLQLAVELGLPLTALVLSLLVWACWRGLHRAWRTDGEAGGVGRAAMVLVLVAGVHSLVEYPLWYAYFLLPTAWAWGLALGLPFAHQRAERVSAPAASTQAAAGLLAGTVMAVAGTLAVLDYMRVVVIYAPSDEAGPLSERISQGQRSVFFAHHADYAAATNTMPARVKDLAFARAPHALLDTRLMMAWAYYLHGQGRTDEARWLAARLREFRNRDADEFFAPCDGGQTQAFQCQVPQQQHGWRSFNQGARNAALGGSAAPVLPGPASR